VLRVRLLPAGQLSLAETCYSPLACAVVGENLAETRLVPARPAGASWCGAHDMAGNVFELVESGLAFGGSFRSPDMTGWPRNTGPLEGRTRPDGRRGLDSSRDDVGFRVALSAVSPTAKL
jgi:hypothetical protein